MLRHRERRLVETLDGVAVFASIVVRRTRKLVVMRILVAVEARCKLHFVNRIFARWQVALVAFHLNVFPLERIFRCDVLFHAE